MDCSSCGKQIQAQAASVRLPINEVPAFSPQPMRKDMTSLSAYRCEHCGAVTLTGGFGQDASGL
jgi:predicted RNA-binding Zn-ribbon protein involved in translation (DUF1610 family)